MQELMQELTYGEKAVGHQDSILEKEKTSKKLKELYAQIIEMLYDSSSTTEITEERERLTKLAITEAQTAQMRAVKAITYPY